MPIEAVVFDFDGTLADTLTLVYHAFNHAFARHLGRTFSRAEIEAMYGPPEEGIAERNVPAAQRDGFLDTFLEYYAGHHAAEARVAPGVQELLADLAPKVGLAVCTGKGQESARISLEALGLDRFFPVVITGTGLTRPKPAPDGVLMACRELGVAPAQAVMVGDSPMDIKAGRAAGCLTAAALWLEEEAGPVLAAHPDAVFRSVPELAAWLRAPIQ